MKKKILKGVANFILLLLVFWHWDDFWQSQFKPLVQAQKDFFPNKYNIEQLKLSHLSKNSEHIQKLQIKIDNAVWAKEEAEKEMKTLRSQIRIAKKSGIKEYKKRVISVIEKLDEL